MKGLLRKELYLIWAYCRIFLLMIAVFIVAGALGDQTDFMVVYPMVIGMIVAVSTLSYDERSKWNVACDAMPVSRAQVVSSKYIVALGSVLVVFVLILIAQGIRLTALGRLPELAHLPAKLLPLGLLGPAVLLPVMLALGVEKGRIIYFIAIGVVCALGVGMGKMPEAQLGTAPESLILLLSCAIFAASWLLAIRLYEKREL
jgi:hypothetical protein